MLNIENLISLATIIKNEEDRDTTPATILLPLELLNKCTVSKNSYVMRWNAAKRKQIYLLYKTYFRVRIVSKVEKVLYSRAFFNVSSGAENILKTYFVLAILAKW